MSNLERSVAAIFCAVFRVERPVVKDGNVIPRPIMYLALSYDHRIIDGKEAVSFLKTVKECLEEPRRLFLDL